MTLAFHPLADLFPLIEGTAFAELVEDIRANGLREPIVMLDGKILDGRNRYRAACAAGLIAEDVYWQGSVHFVRWQHVPMGRFSEAAIKAGPLAYVLSINLHRRHLDESQRAMVAARLASLPQGRPAAVSPDDKAANLPVSAEVKQADAAELLHVSERSVRTARRVQQEGAAELVEAVDRGEVAVSAAAEIAALPVGEQLAILRGADPRAFARVARERRAERQVEKRERREAREIELGARQVALPDKRYGVIYADPEWPFEVWSEAGKDRAAENHYPTSSLEVIASRPVGDIAADDAVLLLWVPGPHLAAGSHVAVMQGWGFAPRTLLTWDKMRPGTGYWFRDRAEYLVLGVRGKVPAPAMGTQWASLVASLKGVHSQKPDWAYELIEAYFPSLPKIELNARAVRPGWDAWGLEAPEAASPGPDLTPAPGGAAASTACLAEPVPAGYAAALVAALADGTPGQFHQASAAPVLRAAYAAEPIVGAARIGADLGHPVGTIRTWLHRLGLADHARLAELARARNAAMREAAPCP